MGMASGLILGILTAFYGRAAYLPAGIWFVLLAASFLRNIQLVSRERQLQRNAAGCDGHFAEHADGLHGAAFVARHTGGLRGLAAVALAAAAFFCGGSHFLRVQSDRENASIHISDGTEITVQGELTGKEIRNGQLIYQLSSCLIGHHGKNHKSISNITPAPCGRILVYSDFDTYSIGEILVLDGTVELWKRAVNEGNFDEASFYEARGVDFKLKNCRVTAAYDAAGKPVCDHTGGWREKLWKLRLKLKQVYISSLGEEKGGILTTMVLGDKELLEQEIKDMYQSCGLSHILAISGLHISIIGMGLYRICRRLRFHLVGAGLAAGGLMYAYGTMAGMGTSVRRALLMFWILLAAQAVGRIYDTLNALGMAAVLMLWENPWLLFDAGFRFSFAAVIGVVWVGKSTAGGKRKGISLWNGIYTGFAIQLATLPAAAWYYYETPVYALGINLLVLPLMAPLLSFGVCGGLLGLFSERLGNLALFPCRFILGFGNLLCKGCAALPGAVFITGKPAAARICLYYAGLAAATVYFHHREKNIKAENAWAWHMAGKFGCGLLLLLILFVPAKRGFELDVLDVGQGDACYMQTERGDSLFVDGGSSDVRHVGEYRILPFLKAKGVRGIDYWFVSHTDSDHISGLKELLQTGYPVKNLVFSEEIEHDDAYLELAELAGAQGAALVYLEAGDCLRLGNAEITALSPAASDTDKNAASLVFTYEENGFSGIFTGDIGTQEEQELLASGRMEQVDFYKAAHHGSKKSNSGEYLQCLKPVISTVSCGAHNRYGHPGQEALANMEAAGSAVLCTMDTGEITIRIEKGALAVQKYLEPLDVLYFPMLE